ncbi:MAG TPA: DNA-3-methyladenine glycosylase 2 family protein [Dehalococcoidia bacterium]|nr:DNA-3-methyladenine glycosylase 2 family protein [Dehalococcoidia bacterium]
MATQRLSESDPKLAAIIRQIGPCRLAKGESGFVSLVNAIVSQQLSGYAYRAIRTRLEALFDGGEIDAIQLSGLSDEDLRSTGLSARKAEYLHGLAAKINSGEIDLKQIEAMDDEAVIETLTRVRGIGRWTVEMYLMFSLNRPDVFPIDDLGIRTAMKELYSLEKDDFPSRAWEIAENWRPYRSIASWYLYAYINELRRK